MNTINMMHAGGLVHERQNARRSSIAHCMYSLVAVAFERMHAQEANRSIAHSRRVA